MFIHLCNLLMIRMLLSFQCGNVWLRRTSSFVQAEFRVATFFLPVSFSSASFFKILQTHCTIELARYCMPPVLWIYTQSFLRPFYFPHRMIFSSFNGWMLQEVENAVSLFYFIPSSLRNISFHCIKVLLIITLKLFFFTFDRRCSDDWIY